MDGRQGSDSTSVLKHDRKHIESGRFPCVFAGCQPQGTLMPPLNLREGTQYVARPPDRSKQKPVLKLFSGETMNSAIAANSAVVPHRFIGILSVM